MKKNKSKLIIISLVVVLIIVAIAIGVFFVIGSKGKYYDNTSLKSLKTFTYVSEFEPTSITESVATITYNYQFKDTEDVIEKYEEYLINEYRFTYDEERSSNRRKYYTYEGQTIDIWQKSEQGIVNYSITLPLTEDKVELNKETRYKKAQELVKEFKYKEALENLAYEELNDYKDVSNLRAYCQGMDYYKTYRFYGSALKYLTQAGTILDAEKYRAEVSAIVSKYNGTYYADNLKYPNNGIGHYIFIKDGMVALELESLYKKGESVMYSYELVDRLVEKTQEYTMMIGSNYTQGDLENNYEYGFHMSEDNTKVLVIAYETNTDTTFNGQYTKVSNEYPNAK